MQSAREQLLEAADNWLQVLPGERTVTLDEAEAIFAVRKAIERARSEPEDHCGCTGPGCPTWEHGHQAGTEAQREPAGGGTT